MKIVCLGDSLTYGFPYDEEVSWAADINKIFGIETLNKGINGDTTHDMLRRFGADVLQHNPTHVAIMGGTNDAYVGESLKNTKNNILRMIELAKTQEIQTILALMPPVADSSEKSLISIRNLIKEICIQEQLSLLDFYNIFLTDEGVINNELFCDDCHPNLAGYQVMARAAVEFFSKMPTKF